MKKLLSTIMALVMLLSLVPMAVAEEGAGTENGAEQSNNVYEVSDAAQLIWAAKNHTGDTIKLKGNVTLSEPVKITKRVVLDLGDYTVTYGGEGDLRAIYVENGADVQIKATANGGVVATTIALQVNPGGKLTVDGGTYNATYAVAVFSNETKTEAVLNSGRYDGFVYTNGTNKNSHVTFNGGTYNEMIYLAAGGQSSYKITDGLFNAALEIDAGQLDILGGTFKSSVDTTNNVNKPATNNNGSGAYQGIIVVCKPDGSSETGYIGDAVVNIKGGTFENTFANGETIVVADFGKDEKGAGDAKVTISGDAVVKGKIALYSSENNDGASLAISGGAFTDLASAVKYAANGATITLAGDANASGYVEVRHPMTIDLNGHKFTSIGGGFDVYADLMLKNGKVETLGWAAWVQSGAKLVVDTDVAIKTTSTAGNKGGITVQNSGSVVTVYGSVEAAGGAAISGIGNKADGGVTINIEAGAVIKNTNEDGVGIYYPNTAALNIKGGTITGATGVYVKSGKTTITGGTINGVGAKADYKYYGNGCNSTGEAFVVDKCNYPGGDPTVEIKGGTFVSKNADAVGSYVGNNATNPLTGFVTGGTFSSNPTAFVADKSLEVSKDTAGQYTVSKKTNAAETSEVKLPAAGTEGTTKAKIDKGDIDTGKDLTVSSEVASVTINQKGVEAIGNNSDLTLTVKTVDQPNDANKAAYDEAIKGNDTDSAIVVDIELSAGSGNAFTQAVEGAYALVTVKYDASGKADKLKVFYLNGSVKQELTKVNDAANGEVNTFSYDDTNKEITMKLPHFSQYLITTTATTSGGNTSGGNSVIKTGAGSSAASGTHTVTTDLTPGSITKVTVDGKVVDAKYYTVSGSNVTFTAEFLKTLKNGSHTVTVENATKIAKGVFTVNNPTTAVQAPTTADAGIALYAGMAIASVMGTGVVFTSRKRKNH